MFKTPTCAITKVFLFGNVLVFHMAATLSLGKTYEGKSSYYLITQSGKSSFSDSFEVYNALDEFGCISLCNNKDGCLKGVYDHDSRSCFLEMDGCKKRKANSGGGALMSTGENVFLFSKVSNRLKLIRGTMFSKCFSYIAYLFVVDTIRFCICETC